MLYDFTTFNLLYHLETIFFVRFSNILMYQKNSKTVIGISINLINIYQLVLNLYFQVLAKPKKLSSYSVPDVADNCLTVREKV